MNGITEQHGHKLYAINGMPDHVHALISMNPKQSPSDFMYHIKRSSSLWINENRLVSGKFTWQEGFGAFSYGKSQISDIAAYIENQKDASWEKVFKEISLLSFKIATEVSSQDVSKARISIK